MTDMRALKRKYSGWPPPHFELPQNEQAAPAMTQEQLDALIMAKAKELVAAEAAQNAKGKKGKATEAAE